jgi:3-oxoacid CoA-transferase A subunit
LLTSYVGEYEKFFLKYISGEIELHLSPQGTLAERIRCGGAGIPAFFTPTGVGTVIQHGGLAIKYNSGGLVAIKSEPKETRVFNGRSYLLEKAITADFAFVKAWKGDANGNLVFRSTAQNLNPDCAKAARIAIAEVEELVPIGELGPDEIHLPGIYIHRVVLSERKEKRIEQPKHSASVDAEGVPILTQNFNTLPPPSELSIRHRQELLAAKTLATRKDEHRSTQSNPTAHQAKSRIARRAALEFRDGMTVNIGIGMHSCLFLLSFVNSIDMFRHPHFGRQFYPIRYARDSAQ